MRNKYTFLICIITTLTFFINCSTTEEVVHDFRIDSTLGKEYHPTVQLYQNDGFNKILLLPVTGKMPNNSKEAFTATFIQTFNKRSNLVVWPKGSVGSTNLNVSQEDVIYYAELLGANAILYLEADYSSLTPPLRITSKLRLENLESGKIIASTEAYYDATNKEVSLGARKFFKKTQLNSTPEFGSEQILSSINQYAQYAGYSLATTCANKLYGQEQEHPVLRLFSNFP